MYRQNHGVAVDYYAVGVFCYECMLGKMPYRGINRKAILDDIFEKQVQIKKHEIPEGWSLEAADFINRLLQRRPINRLGLCLFFFVFIFFLTIFFFGLKFIYTKFYRKNSQKYKNLVNFFQKINIKLIKKRPLFIKNHIRIERAKGGKKPSVVKKFSFS